jgi:hypothetical protein
MPGPHQPRRPLTGRSEAGPKSGDDGLGESGEVIFEIIRSGNAQRIAAVHAATGVEVVVQAPLSLSPADARALALRKLQWRMRKDAGQ